MVEFFRPLLATRFPGHGDSMSWEGDVILLHAISDAVIVLAFLSIAVLLMRFVRRRRDMPFRWIFWAFSLFAVSCGITHALDVVTVWYPLDRLAHVFKAAAALASIGALIAMVRLKPRLLEIPGPAQLAASIDERAEVCRAELAHASAEKIRSDARFRAAFEQAAMDWPMSHRTDNL